LAGARGADDTFGVGSPGFDELGRAEALADGDRLAPADLLAGAAVGAAVDRCGLGAGLALAR
jgi:hypothetical protein